MMDARCKFRALYLTSGEIVLMYYPSRFVSVVRGEDGGNTVIRSYLNPDKPNPMRRYCRIWEAARATSAASTFYDPIAIGPHHQKYVDGALGYNNPIRLLDRESKEMWPDSDRIFISIGTGTAPGASLDGNIIELADRIKEIAIETEKTHEEFYQDHETTLVANHRYFRFNVEGLKRIGLEEHKARPDIYAATETYLESGFAGTMIKQLVGILRSGKRPPSTLLFRANFRSSGSLIQHRDQ
jgi:predicted acylesterase/phospholipase RssA